VGRRADARAERGTLGRRGGRSGGEGRSDGPRSPDPPARPSASPLLRDLQRHLERIEMRRLDLAERRSATGAATDGLDEKKPRPRARSVAGVAAPRRLALVRPPTPAHTSVEAAPLAHRSPPTTRRFRLVRGRPAGVKMGNPVVDWSVDFGRRSTDFLKKAQKPASEAGKGDVREARALSWGRRRRNAAVAPGVARDLLLALPPELRGPSIFSRST